MGKITTFIIDTKLVDKAGDVFACNTVTNMASTAIFRIGNYFASGTDYLKYSNTKVDARKNKLMRKYRKSWGIEDVVRLPTHILHHLKYAYPKIEEIKNALTDFEAKHN